MKTGIILKVSTLSFYRFSPGIIGYCSFMPSALDSFKLNKKLLNTRRFCFRNLLAVFDKFRLMFILRINFENETLVVSDIKGVCLLFHFNGIYYCSEKKICVLLIACVPYDFAYCTLFSIKDFGRFKAI